MRGAWPEKNFTVDPWDRAHPSYIALLFNQGNASNSPCSMSGTLPDVVKAEIGGSFERVSAEQADNIMRLNDAIDCCTPDVCRLAAETAMGGAESRPPCPSANCTLMDIASYWEGRSHYWEDFRGPLSVASNLINTFSSWTSTVSTGRRWRVDVEMQVTVTAVVAVAAGTAVAAVAVVAAGLELPRGAP